MGMEWWTSVSGRLRKLLLVAIVAVLLCGAGLFLYSLAKPSSLLAGLPAVTKTASGHNGDPLNVVIIGDKQQLYDVFHAAHWLIPDPVNGTTTAAIIKASVLNEPYPSAPMSNLYLFNKLQDQAFEYPTASVRARHHVRLWLTSRRIAGKQLWIGAATYDAGLELSGTNHLPTHHISANVDAERMFLAKSLYATRLVSSMHLERLAFPTLWQPNGGGDWYVDDGNAEIIQLK